MANIKTWVLVTNGVRARILRDIEDGDLQDPIELISKAEGSHLREILTDKSGQYSFSPADAERAAAEHGSDPILRDMQDFAQMTLAFLEQHYRAKDFGRLVILAAPKMLSIVQKQLPATLRNSVVLKRAANAIQIPPAELRNAVRRMLKARGMI